jgi:undecaprenyl-diphosphatase
LYIDTAVLRFDAIAFDWIVAHRVGSLDAPMQFISAIGRGGMVWIAAGLALTLFRRFRLQHWAAVALALLMTTVVTDYIIKPLVGRPRPFVHEPSVQVLGDRPSDASFPSGHAAKAAAGASILASAVPGLGPSCWILAAWIAYSRVYLGVHYPLDVIGGALVGLLCASLARMMATRMMRSRSAVSAASGSEHRHATPLGCDRAPRWRPGAGDAGWPGSH